MSTKYTIDVSITPLCPSCGAECEVGLTESRPSNHPIDRDNPYERTDRRVFIQPCPKCYEYIGR
jgi:hypothetical protein